MLQADINSYMDSDINKRTKDIPSGIKQVNKDHTPIIDHTHYY